MDTEWIRSVMTIIAFATFTGIVVWAWSARKRSDFDEAARSILADEGGELAVGKSSATNDKQGRRQ
jgi:cytochrome c oxidase cbb3-type subunit IV